MISDDALKVVTAKLLFESLTAEDREKLLTDALSVAVSERYNPSSYSDKRTKLQVAFENQVAILANKLVHDWLNEPEHKAKLREPIVAAVEKIITSEEFVSKLVDKMTGALWSDR